MRLLLALLAAALIAAPLASAQEVELPHSIYVMRVDGSAVRKVAQVDGFADATSPRWSHDGRRIAFVMKDAATQARHFFVVNADGTMLERLGQGDHVDWSPDDKQLLYHSPQNGGQIMARNLDGSGVAPIGAGDVGHFSPDGGHLAIRQNKSIRVVDLATDEAVELLAEPPARLLSDFVWSPDGKQLALVMRQTAADTNALVLMTAVGEKRELRTRLRDTNLGGGLGFSPDGKQLAVSSAWRIRLLDVEGDRPSQAIPDQKGKNRNPDFSPDGKWIAFATTRTDATAAKPTAAPQRYALQELGRHSKGSIVYSLAYTPDGRKLVLGGDPDNQGVAVFEPETGSVKSLGGQGISVAMFPDGKRIATSWLSPTIQILDLETGDVVRQIEHGGTVRALAVSRDGSRIVSGGLDKLCQVWDAATGDRLATFEGHTDFVARAAFTPDGKSVVSSSYDKTVRRWNAQTGKQEWNSPQVEMAWSLAISPDGRHVLTGAGGQLDGSPTVLVIKRGDDNALRLWDLATGALIRVMKGHTHAAYSIDFSPDGRLAVSGGWDGSVRLWNAESGELLSTIADRQGAVMRAVFSPDGKRVATGGGVARLPDDIIEYPDEQVRIYRVAKE